MKAKYLPIFVIAFLTACMSIPEMVVAAKKGHDATSVQKAKALYYSRQAAKIPSDSLDAQFEIYRYANSLNPEQLEAGYHTGLGYSLLGNESKLAWAKSLMRRYVDTYPHDIYETEMYATVLRALHENPEEATEVLERLLTYYPDRTSVYMTLSSNYAQMGDIEKALGAVRRYEQKEGMSVQTVTTKVSTLLENEDSVGAIAAIDSLVVLKPADPEVWILRGNLFQYIGNLDTALQAYKKAELLAPYEFAPKMNIANLYNQQGDSVRADAKMIEALATNDLSVEEKTEGLVEFIRELVMNGSDQSRSFPMLQALLDKEPGNADLLSLKAIIEEHLRMFDDQIITLREMLKGEAGKDPTMWSQLIIACINAKRFDDIEKYYQEAKQTLSEDNLHNLDVYVASGYAINDMPRKAIEMLTKNILYYLPSYTDTMTPAILADSITHRNYNTKAVANILQMLADQHIQIKDTIAGFRIYDQSLTLDPDNNLTLNNYAYFLALTDGDLDKALEMSLKTITADPDNSTNLDTYAYILFKKREYERAKMYQEMAMENATPESMSAELYEHYGDILFMLGEHKEAVENWKKALEKEPSKEILKRKVEHQTYFYK